MMRHLLYVAVRWFLKGVLWKVCEQFASFWSFNSWFTSEITSCRCEIFTWQIFWGKWTKPRANFREKI